MPIDQGPRSRAPVLRHRHLQGGGGKPTRNIVAAPRQQRINCHPAGPALLEARARRLPDLVRAPVHYYNTEEEVARFAAAVAALA